VSAPAVASRRATTWWLGLTAFGGFAFGLNAERRPFGDDILAHPLLVFFAIVAIGLLVLRAVLRRPVPEILPERALFAGCMAGAVAFLVGNWIDVNLLSLLR
jgi:hypothetical protein